MSTKLAELAKKIGISADELKKKMKELGFELAPRARTVEDETAELILAELSEKKGPSPKEKPALNEKVPGETSGQLPEEKGILDEAVEKKPEDIAEIYDEIIAEQREREIVKSQRKKMAGKDAAAKERQAQKERNELLRKEQLAAAASGAIKIPDTITVKEFAEKTGIKIAKVIGELMKNGILANINQEIDFETAQIIADDLGVKIERIRAVASTEDLLAGDISNLIKEDDAASLQERPPVVCVMGHVDHGKTKLLDSIRKTDVISGESGGITQHIGAYQVEKKGKLITFLDTPGHEAFTAMRARGAKVTDIVILVVAADEGVKPQTIEALNHAKEAKVPIIVALNKIDKPDANVDRVKGELAEHELVSEEWGGKTVMVPISALTGKGVDELLDLVLLTADMENLKANPNREAVGTVVEAHLDPSLGPVATILVNTGTLKTGDNIIVGSTYGRIKLMKDHNGKIVSSAPPSKPVFIAGLSITPKSGDILQAVKTESQAKERAGEVALISKQKAQEKLSGLNQVISSIKSEKILKIVLKADTKGSLEALKGSLAKIKHDEVAIKVIHGGVGTITESDILMASASKGIILGFHTEFDSPGVKRSAEREGVEVRKYMIIYEMLEDVKKLLSGLLEPEVIETMIGKATVHQIFFAKRNEFIAGLKVTNGKLEPKVRVKILRGKDDEFVGEGIIESLRKGQDQVKEMKEGGECGIKFVGNIPLQENDVLEAYKKETHARTL
ncbi:MAG: translation initiation factor IF-2 [Candidatus Gracilibacteria bacterium]